MSNSQIMVLLVDPKTQTIEEFSIPNTLAAYYETLECDMVQWVPIGDRGDGIFCDEEGRMQPDVVERGGTHITGVLGPVIGKFIVVGDADDDGYTMSTTLKIKELLPMISWATTSELEHAQL